MIADLNAGVADDLLHERLTYVPPVAATSDRLKRLPFPAGKRPQPLVLSGHPSDRLPSADVMVVTWTAAEFRALADVFTPGVTWLPYVEGWSHFEPHLTGRSPARFQRCLAHVAAAEIDGRRVLCVKSELHLSTDDDTLPLRALWNQMLAEVQPKLVISTGTAGGIGADTSLGDILASDAAKFNCTKTFAKAPFAQERFVASSTVMPSSLMLEEAHGLIAVNADQLRPVAQRVPAVYTAGDVETVDYFAFADEADSYGVVANDPQALVEEMDDAVLAMVCEQDLKGAQPWLLVRNASDPQVPAMPSLEAEAKWAASVYRKYGYWTSIGSAIVCWAAICSL